LSYRILVVEDRMVNMEMVTALLQAAGCEVIQATSGEEGVDRARREQPSAILMDIGLPGISGIEATRVLKEDPGTRDIPVIAVTALARGEDRAAALEAGCDGYLTKPLDTRQFWEEVSAIIEAAQVAGGGLAERRPPLLTSDPSLTRGRILVVDDEPAARHMLVDLLTADGHHVTAVGEGESALKHARSDPPDVILLDALLPGMSGFEVCQWLKADPRTMGTQVLMVSVLQEKEARIRGIAAGANDFLTKPLDPREVGLRVRNYVITKRLLDRTEQDLRRVRELESRRESLTQMVVHDLRSPLMGVMGYLELLEMDELAGMSEESAEYVRRALRSAETVIEMVDTVLDVGRLEEGAMPLQVKRADLRTVVREAAALVGGHAPHVIVVPAPTDPVEIDHDPAVMRRLMVNLLSNAVKFSPAPGSVVISLDRRVGVVRVSVVDRGPGIPEAYRATVFEKYIQLESQLGAPRSSGLGLTFCRLAVEAHGGIIGVDAPEEGGSVFWFELPTRD